MNELLLDVKDHVFANVEFYLRDTNINDPGEKADKVAESIIRVYAGIVKGNREFEQEWYEVDYIEPTAL
jgi:hypothetical protein